MIAFVRSVIASATASGVTISVSRSTSTHFTVAPLDVMRLIVLTHVSAGVITSSPGPTPRACSIRCMPAVPLVTATHEPSDRPMYAAKAFSNALQCGPVPSHPPRITSLIASIVASLISGRQ